ncbi:hypothetical protein [Afipia carboxidovorans]|uniref:hypothetical protein n=1 Tax=Afipia carboxidovorans TaxID=40137 RepID=UPI00308E3558|nr:hypothetical protein CRBSH125_05910 [Afipia carboxidovorans]
MSNVREVEFRKPAADADLVRVLEEWTELARTGELQAVGICGVKSNGRITTEWNGASRGHLMSMISAVSTLQFRIMLTNIEPG